MSVSASPSDVLQWYDRIKSTFAPYKPEAKSMFINYGSQTGTIELSFKIEQGFRKKHSKIKIPAYYGFKIKQMKNATFTRLDSLWKKIDDEWVLNTKDLPSSDGYLVELEGIIDKKIIDDLVYIKPSINPDTQGDDDKYYLDASLKNPKIIESVWSELQINDVDIGVRVDVTKMFGLNFPDELKAKYNAIQNYLAAGKTTDRHAIFKSGWDYRRQDRKSSYHPNDFLDMIKRLTTRDTLLEYVSVDKDYTIGNIDNMTDTTKELLPKDVNVQALTNLTLSNPHASGYLTMHRERYIEKIKENVDDFLKKKSDKE